VVVHLRHRHRGRWRWPRWHPADDRHSSHRRARASRPARCPDPGATSDEPGSARRRRRGTARSGRRSAWRSGGLLPLSPDRDDGTGTGTGRRDFLPC